MCIIIILYSLLLVFFWFWIRKTIYSLLSSYTSSSVGFYTILIVLMQHVRVQSYNQESWGKVSAADARLDSARQESCKACHRDIWFFFVSVYTVVEMFS